MCLCARVRVHVCAFLAFQPVRGDALQWTLPERYTHPRPYMPEISPGAGGASPDPAPAASRRDSDRIRASPHQ